MAAAACGGAAAALLEEFGTSEGVGAVTVDDVVVVFFFVVVAASVFAEFPALCFDPVEPAATPKKAPVRAADAARTPAVNRLTRRVALSRAVARVFCWLVIRTGFPLRMRHELALPERLL